MKTEQQVKATIESMRRHAEKFEGIERDVIYAQVGILRWVLEPAEWSDENGNGIAREISSS